MNDEIAPSSDLDNQTVLVTSSQSELLNLLCRALEQVSKGTPAIESRDLKTAVESLAQIAQQAGAVPSPGEWQAHRVRTIQNGGAVLVLKGPDANELVVHLDTEERPYWATWAGASQKVAEFAMAASGSGMELQIATLSETITALPLGPVSPDQIWSKTPVFRSEYAQLQKAAGGLVAEKAAAAESPATASDVTAPPLPASPPSPPVRPSSPSQSEPSRLAVVPPPLPAAQVCSRCGNPLKPGIKFCGNCGAPVPALSPVPQPPLAAICPQCGKEIKPGVKFCRNCGASLG